MAARQQAWRLFCIFRHMVQTDSFVILNQLTMAGISGNAFGQVLLLEYCK